MKLEELKDKIKFEDILDKYNYNWNEISKHKYLSQNFIDYYKDKLNWY